MGVDQTSLDRIRNATFPSSKRNHSVPRSSRRSPDFGSVQTMVHSITASLPSSMPCSRIH